MAARGKGQQLEVHSSLSGHWSSSAPAPPSAGCDHPGTVTAWFIDLIKLLPPPFSRVRHLSLIDSVRRNTTLLAQQSHFTSAIVSVPCNRCPYWRGASTRTAPRAGRVVVERRPWFAERSLTEELPRLGLTLGSRPSILRLAHRYQRHCLAGSGTPPTSFCTYPHTPPAAAFTRVCDPCSPTSAPLTTTDNPRVTHCARKRPPAADSSSSRIEPPTYRPSFQHASLRWDKVGAAQAGSPVCSYS